MPIRRFNGTSSLIDVSIGASDLKESAYTIAYLIRMRNDTVYGGIFTQQTASNVAETFSERSSGNHITAGAALTESESSWTLKEADGWCLIAITKASGTVKPNFYKIVLPAKTLTKGEGATTVANATVAATKIRFGAWESTDFLKADLAVTACWKRVLSQAEVEALASAASLEAWLTTSPAGLWFFNQAVVTEEVKDKTAGGANQTARTATEVIAEEPPIPYTETVSSQALLAMVI